MKQYPDMTEFFALKEAHKASLSPEERERRWQVIKRAFGPLWEKLRKQRKSKQRDPNWTVTLKR